MSLDWPKRIREYRFRHGLKQSALADDFGVSQALVSLWERGRCNPPQHVKAAVLERFPRADSNEVLRFLKMSVASSFGPSALLSVKGDDLVFEALSGPAVSLVPQITRDDLHGSMRGKMGEETDEHHARFIAEGGFDRDVAGAESHKVVRFGEDLAVARARYTAITLGQERFFRSDVAFYGMPECGVRPQTDGFSFLPVQGLA